MVVLFRPGAQFHAEAFRAARVPNAGKAPDGGPEAMLALAAAEWKDANGAAKLFAKSAQPRDAQAFRSALRATDEGHDDGAR